MASKAEIWALFYGEGTTTRAGGGKPHKSIQRLSPSFEAQEKVRVQATLDSHLKAYFEKLQTRDGNLAPPPKPK